FAERKNEIKQSREQQERHQNRRLDQKQKGKGDNEQAGLNRMVQNDGERFLPIKKADFRLRRLYRIHMRTPFDVTPGFLLELSSAFAQGRFSALERAANDFALKNIPR